MKRSFCAVMVLILLLGVAAGLLSCTSDSHKGNGEITDTQANTETENVGDGGGTANGNGGETTDDGGNSDNTDNVTPDGGETGTTKTAIIENGKAVYSIAYPKGASSDTMSAVFNFWNAIYKVTGVSLAIVNDADAASEGS